MSEIPNGTVSYRLGQVETALRELKKESAEEISELRQKVDRLVLAIVGASLTFAISVGVMAVTLLASGPP